MKKLIIISICIFTAVFAEARGCGPCGPGGWGRGPCGPGGWGRGPCGPGGWGPPPPGPGWGHGGWWGRGGCNFWPGFAGGVIGGMIGSACWNRPYYGYAPYVNTGYTSLTFMPPPATVVQPTVVTQPVVVQPTTVVTQPVVTRTPVWIPGQYVTSANGVSVWQPGHYQ